MSFLQDLWNSDIFNIVYPIYRHVNIFHYNWKKMAALHGLTIGIGMLEYSRKWQSDDMDGISFRASDNQILLLWRMGFVLTRLSVL